MLLKIEYVKAMQLIGTRGWRRFRAFANCLVLFLAEGDENSFAVSAHATKLIHFKQPDVESELLRH